MGPVFELQLVHRGIGPKALKRGKLMARSKNRVLEISPDGRVVTVQVQLENGEVVRSRPLCPYPQVAEWNGVGSTNEASSFTCVMPN